MRILLVDDDERIRDDLSIILGRNSYAVDTARSLAVAAEKLADVRYDLVILDWSLPDGEGTSLIPAVRAQQTATPVMMLTARGQSEDVVSGLDAGADDYIPKPFAVEVLLARVRSLVRRNPVVPSLPTIRVADLTIVRNTQTVTRSDIPIRLSPKEYALLEYLALNTGRTVDRMTILEHVWGENTDEFSNTVDVHIRSLRKKIDDPFKTKLIRTVKNAGYLITAP
jgi:DNA-binding response OmpR family regulator